MDRSRRIAMKHNAGSILISRESADKSADGFWRVRISLSSKKGKTESCTLPVNSEAMRTATASSVGISHLFGAGNRLFIDDDLAALPA
jgi:hypothetical protein